tara:strand:- start:560 stop:664 length:105 start_codon:yes stop_codon:yes gene_type:complete
LDGSELEGEEGIEFGEDMGKRNKIWNKKINLENL